jgi:TRAP-type mannitol/chloroaromatic compound transport system permease small subunit
MPVDPKTEPYVAIPTNDLTFVARVLVGLPICAVLAYATVSFIALAWEACDDAEPPYLFGPKLFVLPMIGFALWVGWAVVAVVLRRRSWRLSVSPNVPRKLT